jgi:hydrogenase nickel incorporation protein HypA/HybF
MHEMAICESLLGVLESEAARHNYNRVRMVRLEVGSLAGVEPEALLFSFDVVTRGSLAEGAALEIVETRPEAWCLNCSHAVAVQQRFDACPDCGGYQLQLSGGDELKIKELEVD